MRNKYMRCMIPMKLQIFAEGGEDGDGAGAGDGNGGGSGIDNPGAAGPKPVSFDEAMGIRRSLTGVYRKKSIQQ